MFIDESGDPGFKVDSSSHLVMAMVIFDDYKVADITRDAIWDLMSRLNHKPEFRFSSCSATMRTQFFEHMESHDFRVRAIVAAKEDIGSHFLRNKPHKFYNFLLRQLITHNELQGAKVRIDGEAKRDFLKAAKSYLRKEAPPGVVDNVRFLDSKSEALIQLADMATGAIARSHKKTTKTDAHKWHGMLGDKIEDIWEFR